MASIIEQLDLDLCRKILLRTEEVMGSDRPKGPDNYYFEGYDFGMVEYNLRKLYDYGAICVRERIERYQGVLNYWPVLLYDKGLAFIEAARNDEIWNRALEQIEERGVQPTLKRAKRILLAVWTSLLFCGKECG